MQFRATPGLDPEALGRLIGALERIRGLGVAVVVFLPPFSDEVWDLLPRSETLRTWWAQYRRLLPSRLREAGIACIPVSSPRDYGLDDRYMLDGFHPGEVLMGHIVRRFLAGAADPGLLSRVDVDYLETLLSSAESSLAFKTPSAGSAP